jgi:hypothetical protein
MFNNIARRLKKPIATFIGDFFNNATFYKKIDLVQKKHFMRIELCTTLKVIGL